LGKYNGCSPSGVLTPPRCNSKSYSERWPFNVVGVSFQHKFGWRGGTELGKRIGTPSHSGPATRGSSRGRAKPQVMACRFHDEAEGAPDRGLGEQSFRGSDQYYSRSRVQLNRKRWLTRVILTLKCSLLKSGMELTAARLVCEISLRSDSCYPLRSERLGDRSWLR
jgi:hypothetical protein